MAVKLGSYLWEHPKGAFQVFLRPNNVFFCPSFPAQASWQCLAENTLQIDWKKFGLYNFQAISEGLYDGSLVSDTNAWRKMKFVRDFNDVERLLLVCRCLVSVVSLSLQK